jgi:hypothetical protein
MAPAAARSPRRDARHRAGLVEAGREGDHAVARAPGRRWA